MYHRNINMADFQNDYRDSTDAINSIVTTQLSQVPQWSNIPGSLVKASSSVAGYVWGYNSSDKLFRCQSPCTGKWEMVDLTSYNLQGIHDITTDDTSVYVLAQGTDAAKYLLITNATSTSGWIQIKIPFSANFIFSTHTYIWAQDSQNNKQKCAKPCTTGAWIVVRDSSGVRITSSSDTTLYGINQAGHGVKSEETMESGWSEIAGMAKYNVSAVIGQIDSSALYGVDDKANLFRCEGDCSKNDVEIVDLAGYVPANISPDPGSADLWLTTKTVNNKGNVYNKMDRVDYSGIMNKINPLDKGRDDIIKEVSTQYNLQTNVMSANKQVTDFVNYFKKIFNLKEDSVKKIKGNVGELEDEIRDIQIQLDQYNNVEPVFQQSLILITIIIFVYLIGSLFLGSFVHVIAFLILGAGVVYIAYILPHSKDNATVTSTTFM